MRPVASMTSSRTSSPVAFASAASRLVMPNAILITPSARVRSPSLIAADMETTTWRADSSYSASALVIPLRTASRHHAFIALNEVRRHLGRHRVESVGIGDEHLGDAQWRELTLQEALGRRADVETSRGGHCFSMASMGRPGSPIWAARAAPARAASTIVGAAPISSTCRARSSSDCSVTNSPRRATSRSRESARSDMNPAAVRIATSVARPRMTTATTAAPTTMARCSDLECALEDGAPVGPPRAGWSRGVRGTACVEVMEESVICSKSCLACSASDRG